MLAPSKAFDVAEWFNMPGDPLAFASSLTKKPVLYLIALGDQEVPNPTNSTFIRAASGQSSTWLYRPDRACEIVGSTALAVAASPLPLRTIHVRVNRSNIHSDGSAATGR